MSMPLSMPCVTGIHMQLRSSNQVLNNMYSTPHYRNHHESITAQREGFKLRSHLNRSSVNAIGVTSIIAVPLPSRGNQRGNKDLERPECELDTCLVVAAPAPISWRDRRTPAPSAKAPGEAKRDSNCKHMRCISRQSWTELRQTDNHVEHVWNIWKLYPSCGQLLKAVINAHNSLQQLIGALIRN